MSLYLSSRFLQKNALAPPQFQIRPQHHPNTVTAKPKAQYSSSLIVVQIDPNFQVMLEQQEARLVFAVHHLGSSKQVRKIYAHVEVRYE